MQKTDPPVPSRILLSTKLKMSSNSVSLQGRLSGTADTCNLPKVATGISAIKSTTFVNVYIQQYLVSIQKCSCTSKVRDLFY